MTSAAVKAGMDEKTARRYARLKKLPSEVRAEHNWRTRRDPFAEVWPEVRAHLELNSGLEAKTLFEDLQRRYPGRFAEGQLRTLQRRIKHWRATEGPPKEVFFAQVYVPGERSQSDYTHMSQLGVTIQGQPFPHLIYHFVLPYSNWETGTVCFSESFESLSEGLQDALWELGGTPAMHQTDRLSSAVNTHVNREVFTRRYQGLLAHYGMKPRATQAASPHENGDVEQRHFRFKKALEQALLLRGSRDFAGRDDYERFLRGLFKQLNAGRQERLAEERTALGALPSTRLDTAKRLRVKVTSGSTIRVYHNTYSVDSRLIGESVEVRLAAEHLDVYYGGKHLERLPRLIGRGGHRIAYRHVIDWLVRKPGAFENYRYRADLFPTHRFRMAYDAMRERRPQRADKDYLRILEIAARENEAAVDAALAHLFERDTPVTVEAVAELVTARCALPAPREVFIEPVRLGEYDTLLTAGDGASREVAL